MLTKKSRRRMRLRGGYNQTYYNSAVERFCLQRTPSVGDVADGSKAALTFSKTGSRDGRTTDIVRLARLVRFVQRRNSATHSITSSARARREGGTMRSSAFAALRLITNSSLVGNSTGKSPGATPCRIL